MRMLIICVAINLSFVFLSACEAGRIGPACQFDTRTTGGLCISNTAQNFEIRPEHATFTINTLNKYFVGFNLPAFLHEHNVKLTTMDELDARGVAILNAIYIRPPNIRGPQEDCWAQHYVLGHQIIHIVARWWLQLSSESNANHSDDWLWASSLGDDSIEGQFSQEIYDLCIQL